MDHFDVVVVGAGPAGSLAARAAVEGGATTLLVDHRPELGHPVQCGEFVPAPSELADLFGCRELIDRAFVIPESTVLRSTRTMACISPFGHVFRFPLAGCTVSRRAFDKALAGRAEGAGAELRFPLGVTGVRDDLVDTVSGSIRAKVVIGADGPISTVGHSVGFHPRREMFRMITATVDGPLDDQIDVYFGRVAPGGYAWRFPRAHDANVGLGVAKIPSGVSLGGLLDRFLARQQLGPARSRTTWWVPLGPPPESLVSGRALFAGDAANLVMATNGGGIPTAMLSGWLAGATAARHVREGLPLSTYDTAWREALYRPLERAARIQWWSERLARPDPLLALGMRYIGVSGLDAMMRLRWPPRLGGNS
ncbi:MAG TPA: geranylgeranyl reductase family protein [Thermoplasmata archaeon]|jgi:digeranylgeranylglycerophospholipid reductase|nr:geranylgeranyl reductase family protein [Thermoplasmata archaeon]